MIEACERAEELTMMDDAFMTAVLHDNLPAAQLMVRALMARDDVEVVEMRDQGRLPNLRGHSVVMDVVARDSAGAVYNIEVQRDSRGASPERLRYHAAMLDADALLPGMDFRELPDAYVFFICEADPVGAGLPLYRYGRVCRETGDPLGDRSWVAYVNCSYAGSWEDAGLGLLGQVVSDMACAEPDNMCFEEFSSRARGLKVRDTEEEAMLTLNESYQNGVRDGLAEGKAKGKAEGIAQGKAEGIAQGKAEGIAQGKAEGIAQGKAEGIAQGKAEGIAQGVKALMASMGVGAEEALRMMGVDESERAAVLEALATLG